MFSCTQYNLVVDININIKFKKSIFKLQKRVARVILNVKTRKERTTTFFRRLNWLPFYYEVKINKCSIVYNCIIDSSSALYCLRNSLIRVSDRSSRISRYGEISLCCPRYKRETEGARSFSVTAAKLWNNLLKPVEIRRYPSLYKEELEMYFIQ